VSVYEVLLDRPLDSPVLILAMDGWIDAGFGAAGAVAHLLGQVTTDVMVRFDGGEFVDYRARRPTVRLVDGMNTGLTWPEIELRAGRDGAGHDMLVLAGPEPDMRWRLFVSTVVEMAGALGVRLVCGLGAFPAAVPHTRPVRLASTATVRELAERVGYVTGTLEAPAGVHAALEEGFAAAGVPAVGLWARVPHYAATMPYPAASAALIEGLAAVAGLELDARDLRAAAALAGSRIDQAIANSDEHAEMVRQLEATLDKSEAGPPIDPRNLPSGDEIAAELERFLRGE